jgi:hypothetical protein
VTGGPASLSSHLTHEEGVFYPWYNRLLIICQLTVLKYFLRSTILPPPIHSGKSVLSRGILISFWNGLSPPWSFPKHNLLFLTYGFFFDLRRVPADITSRRKTDSIRETNFWLSTTVSTQSWNDAYNRDSGKDAASACVWEPTGASRKERGSRVFGRWSNMLCNPNSQLPFFFFLQRRQGEAGMGGKPL